LNALLKYLQEDKELANRKKQRSSLSVHSTISQEDKGSSDMSATVIGFRNASYYKIKCNILRIFAAVTSNSALLKVRSFVHSFVHFFVAGDEDDDAETLTESNHRSIFRTL